MPSARQRNLIMISTMCSRPDFMHCFSTDVKLKRGLASLPMSLSHGFDLVERNINFKHCTIHETGTGIQPKDFKDPYTVRELLGEQGEATMGYLDTSLNFWDLVTLFSQMSTKNECKLIFFTFFPTLLI